MKIAAVTMRFLLDGEEDDDLRRAIHTVEVAVQKMMNIDPATILVIRCVPDKDVMNAWDVSIQIPFREEVE